jgi:hypothetical protein
LNLISTLPSSNLFLPRMAAFGSSSLLLLACLWLSNIASFPLGAEPAPNASAPVAALKSSPEPAQAATSAAGTPTQNDAETPNAIALDQPAKIALLTALFEKQLIGTDSLNQALPVAWLAEDFASETERKLLENQLQQLLEQQHDLPASQAVESQLQIDLLRLQLQWLHASAQQRKQLLADANSKKLISDNEQDSRENLSTAKIEAKALAENTQDIQQALRQAADERQIRLLSIRLALEKQFSALNQARQYLGKVQADFSTEVKTWQATSADIAEALENEFFRPGTQDFSSSRLKVRQLLTLSNSTVRTQTDFLQRYFPKDVLIEDVSEIPTVQIRDTDDAEARELIQEIQQKRISFQLDYDRYLKDRAGQIWQTVQWQQRYRQELVELRGLLIAKVIEDYAFVINQSEPVLVELDALASNVSFWLWRSAFLNQYAEQLTNQQFRFNKVTHIFRLVLMIGVIGWLFFRRREIIFACRRWLCNQFSHPKALRFIRWLTTVIADLYVFIVLFFAGNLAIDLAISFGFDEARYAVAILNQVVLFFLLLGLVNYISPLLSQRHQRKQKFAKDVAAVEAVFEFLPKVYLYYWLITSLVSILFSTMLSTNLSNFYLDKLLMVIAISVMFAGVWRDRLAWRKMNDQANTSLRWRGISQGSADKVWEPLVLVFGGGIGVYRVAWRILADRLTELEMTRSFQAMLSRAIIERQHRRYTVQLNASRFPEPYWQAFDFRIAAKPDWYVSRSEIDAALHQAYQEWQQQGTTTRILLCGDRGVGKSEVIAQFVRSQPMTYLHARIHTGDTSVAEICHRLSTELLDGRPMNNGQELIAAINALPKSVIALENIENCVLRKVDGFQAFSFVIDLLLQTSGQHMWLTTFTSYAWSIARQGVPGAGCFSDVIHIGGVSEEQLKSLILCRHNQFHQGEPNFNELQMKSPQKGQPQQQQEIAEKNRNLYFRILWDYTRGNPRQALYYWKASLFLHENKLAIKLFDVPEQRVLENLSDVTLMTLAALIEHNGLTLAGLTQVMNDHENNIRRRIEELVPHGIVFSFDDGERAGWHVESFWTRAVENYLVKRQFLFKGAAS